MEYTVTQSVNIKIRGYTTISIELVYGVFVLLTYHSGVFVFCVSILLVYHTGYSIPLVLFN